jgi:hypothetical protein
VAAAAVVGVFGGDVGLVVEEPAFSTAGEMVTVLAVLADELVHGSTRPSDWAVLMPSPGSLG